MSRIQKKTLIMSWILQIIAVTILAPAGVMKLLATEGNLYIFVEKLSMGYIGMYLIGIIELTACVLMLTPLFVHWGALFAFGTMLGAIIAHGSFLGFNVHDDGGMLVILLTI